MYWLIAQGNGLFAQFSNTLSDFVDMNLTYAEVIRICQNKGMSISEATRQIDEAFRHRERLCVAIQQVRSAYGDSTADARALSMQYVDESNVITFEL